MNKIAVLSSLFFTVISVIAAPSQAEESQKPPQKPDFMKTVDKNADGKASKAEFFAAMEKKFHSMDVDKSEVISVQELKLYGEKDPEALKKLQQAAQDALPEKVYNEEAFIKRFTDRGEKEFTVLDKNHDQELSANELGVKTKVAKKTAKVKPVNEKKILKEDFIAVFTESAERNFAQLDKNYDGELTNDELGIPKSKLKSESVPATQTPELSKSAEPQDKKAVEKQKLIKSFFVGIDANNDGQISNKEKTAAFESLFNRLDSNHDQFITPDEIITGQHSVTESNL